MNNSLLEVLEHKPEMTWMMIANGTRIFPNRRVQRDPLSPLLYLYRQIHKKLNSGRIPEPQLGYPADYLDTPHLLKNTTTDPQLRLSGDLLKFLLNQQILELGSICIERVSDTTKLLERVGRFYEDMDGWVSIDYADPYSGWTILHWAAQYGSLPLVHELISTYRANPNMITHLDETPLLLASREGHQQVVTYLEKYTQSKIGYLDGPWTPTLYQNLKYNKDILNPTNKLEDAIKNLQYMDNDLLPVHVVLDIALQRPSSDGLMFSLIPRIVQTLPEEVQDLFGIFMVVVTISLFKGSSWSLAS